MTILSQAETIRDETETGANSAARVGNCLVAIAERLEAPAIGNLFMVGNTVDTTVVTPGTFVKIAGTTTDNDELNNLFSYAAKRLTYTGDETRLFVVHLQATVHCDHGSHIVELGIYHSGLGEVDPDHVGRTMIQAGANKPTQVCTMGIYQLATGDYIEAHLTGVDSVEDYLVTNLNMLITEA